MGSVLVDIAVAAFVGFAIWRGWKRGLVRAGAKIIGLVVAVVAAALLSSPAASLVSQFGVSDRWDNLVGAGVVFFVVVVSFRFIGDRIARALRFTKVGTLVDAGGGAALSGLWALTVTALALLSLSLFDDSPVGRAVEDSSLGSAVVETAPDVAKALAGADLRRWLADLLGPDQSQDR